MKKFLFILLCAFASIGASAQDGKLTLNTGFLFPSTLNATLGYEHPLSYGNAVEVFGEVGDHWQTPVSDRFGKVIIGTAVCCTSTALSATRTGCFVSVSARSSGLYNESSFSVWRQALNTVMCFRTAGSSLLSKRTT